MSRALVALHRFVRQRPSQSLQTPATERCDLCGLQLGTTHHHLVRAQDQQIVCACAACALLLPTGTTGRYRQIADTIEPWPDFIFPEATWDALGVAIRLAFFVPRSTQQRVTAYYPSPAGAIASQLPTAAWDDLVTNNPRLGSLRPDVEALLVHHIGESRDHVRVPISECYRLVGLVRTHWRGLRGGTEVWTEVTHFFNDLRQRAHV